MKNSKIKLTNNSLSDTSNFTLYNTSNYKVVIQNSVSEILLKFIEVIIEYMRFISDKIIIKNNTHYRFIFERGIDTLIHVFSIIFYYTKNLELTFYHTQKAFYFYIEFIEQISDDTVTFLQLSSRDAILFVYKKTIFDLNNGYKKHIQDPTTEEKDILATVDLHMCMYKSIIMYIINHNDFKYEHKNDYINSSCDSIEIISKTLNKNNINPNYINCLYMFITLLADKKIKISDFFKLLDDFIKKSINKKYDEKVIKNKIYDLEINNLINNNELNNIVELILC